MRIQIKTFKQNCSNVKPPLFIVFFFVFFTFSGLSSNMFDIFAVEQQLHTNKEVLVIQSYQRDYIHVRDIEQGIDDYFANYQDDVWILYEYLDTKNYSSLISSEHLVMLMKDKYSNKELDGIILADDDALEFYIRHSDTIWPDVEHVVAIGINSFIPYPDGVPGVVLMEERPLIDKTIDIALKQNDNKNIDTLSFIYDSSSTGKNIYEDTKLRVEEGYNDYMINHYLEHTPDELKSLIETADQNEIFIFVLHMIDRNGEAYNYDVVPSYIVQNAVNPVYALFEMFRNTGVAGGHLASSNLLGKNGADTLHKLWQDEQVPNLIYEKGTNHRYIFNYEVLQRYGIRYIPANSILLNKPLSFYEQNKEMLITLFLVIIIFSIIIKLLLNNLNHKRSLNNRNQEVAKLNKEMIATQKDLIYRLGDVIESRSKETASHVRRVVEMSRVLGTAYGLNEEQVLMLCTISPMHDIGKIGIADIILNKPGKLSDLEFQIIKHHTTIGYEILQHSERKTLKYASIVALEHHERWDGQGYPYGKKGEDIHIFARITAIVDVYDAIRSKRVYKEAWSVEKSVEYIKQEKGKFFDPKLLDLFLERIDEMETIRINIKSNEIGICKEHRKLQEIYDKLN